VSTEARLPDEISQVVRDFAAKECIAEADAQAKSMKVMSVELVMQRAKVYHKACASRTL